MRAGNTIQEARSRYMDNASELQLHAPNMQLVEANIAHLGRVLDQGLALPGDTTELCESLTGIEPGKPQARMLMRSQGSNLIITPGFGPLAPHSHPWGLVPFEDTTPGIILVPSLHKALIRQLDQRESWKQFQCNIATGVCYRMCRTNFSFCCCRLQTLQPRKTKKRPFPLHASYAISEICRDQKSRD